MVPVLEQSVVPVLVVHGEFASGGTHGAVIDEADLHVDQQTFFVSRVDEILGGDGAVKTDEVEAVLLRLPDVFDGGILEGPAGHVGVFVGDDAADVSPQEKRTPVEQDRLISAGGEVPVAETFRNAAVGGERVENGMVRGPGGEGGRIQKQDGLSIPDRLFQHRKRNGRTFAVFDDRVLQG